MKKILLLSITALLSLSCSKMQLETFPSNKVPADVVFGSVDNAQKALNGALNGLGLGAWTDYSSGFGFGFGESAITADALAEDYVLSGPGSGWMWQTYSYSFKSWFDDERLQQYTQWNCFYTTINSCNNLIAAGDLLADSPKGQAILGQARVLRALSYHMLAQFWARAYYYYPDDLCVPVYLEPTTSATKGQPRSTNKEVYENVIMPDLTTGIALLKEAKMPRASKTEIDYAVANGILARVALTMHNWKTAAAAAEEVLKEYGSKMLAPSDITAGMNDVPGLSSVMWGDVKTTDNYGMYRSFFAQMDADHDGYAKGARRCILPWLYAKMNPTDARRAWWNGTFDNANYASSGPNIKYNQVKFRFKPGGWLGDYIYMRAEEMLLTAAEAYCHDSQEGLAQARLKTLMEKRDPAYKGATKTGKELGTLTTDEKGSLLEEILIQRRLELWGEYGRLFDIKRLGQGFVRQAPEKSDNPDFDPSSLVALRDTESPGTFAWIFLFPQVELDGNPNIVQNPVGDK